MFLISQWVAVENASTLTQARGAGEVLVHEGEDGEPKCQPGGEYAQHMQESNRERMQSLDGSKA